MIAKTSDQSLDGCTETQRRVYRYVADHIEGKGYPPSVREIMNHFELKSPNGAMCHLRALERKGLIERDNNVARGIRLVGAA